MITFEGNKESYIRIPLATFSADQNNKCILYVFNNTLNQDQNQVVVGSMFFNEFYTLFTNQFSD